MTTAPTALVTGASTGLGLAIAAGLARAGYDLAVTALDARELPLLLANEDFAGRKVVGIVLDQRRQDDIESCFAEARAALGHVDVLVNNAARALVKPAVEVSPHEWDDVLDTNLRGGFFLAQQFARACIAAKRPGAIVNISSTHGETGIAGRAIYGIAKGGLNQMTRMLAIEWAEHAIRVNAVAPTTVMTPSRRQALSDPVRRAEMLARIPLGKFPDESEIAAAVVYLASPAAAAITGHILRVDGGLAAA